MSRFASQIALWLLLLMGLWLAGLGWFMQQIPKTPVGPVPVADGIVVLTGGGGRMEKALQLLSQGKGKALFVSGANDGVTLADLLARASAPTRAALKKRFGQQPPIHLGHAAQNTIGNALETRDWLREIGYKRILLVTSNYHMPRSLNEFRENLGDVEIIPVAVLPEDFTLEDGMADPQDRALLMSEYHKYMASVLRHAFVSVMR
jgi:uncharacterized SAM-binding protein YcdF (DUF218 family)